MKKTICCVCHQPVGATGRRLGGRDYCERHYLAATRGHPGIWQAGLALIVGQIVFVLLIEVLAGWLKPLLNGTALIIGGLALALVPAALWLAFFYQQDRLEPEPTGYVLAIFVLGALLAQAVGTPLLQDAFEVQRWLALDPWVGLLGAILVVGFTQEFLKYAAVRYTIYTLPEFDERMDGVIYGAAVGLGYATMLNFRYVLENGGVDLQVGIIRIVVTALAQATFAGLTGYFLGRAKFEETPVWWLPVGLSGAAILNGVFTTLHGALTTTEVRLSGGGFTPWPGLILATLVAGGALGLLFYLMRSATAQTLAIKDPAPQDGDGGAQ